MPNEIIALNTTRKQCPFYGFSFVMGIFMGQRSNQCGLITDSYNPCKMQLSEQKVSWNNCQYFNTEENAPTIESILNKCTIFPDELHPEGSSSWEGIPMRKW